MINWQNGVTPINETNMNKLVQEDMITDAYSSSSTYAVGDYCIYGNTLYKCTTAIATAEAWNSAHWTEATVIDAIQSLLNIMNPVGTIKMTTINTNPGTYLPGTWVAWGSGRVPVGVDTSQTEFNTVEKTGGEKTHQLTVDEMPSHNHAQKTNYGRMTNMLEIDSNYGFAQNGAYKDRTVAGTTATTNIYRTSYEGGDQAHNNLQPYITCYMWKRTA